MSRRIVHKCPPPRKQIPACLAVGGVFIGGLDMERIEEINHMIQTAYVPLIEMRKITQRKIDNFISENQFLQSKDDTDKLIYYLVWNHRYEMAQYWPLTDSELEHYYLDMGIAFD